MGNIPPSFKSWWTVREPWSIRIRFIVFRSAEIPRLCRASRIRVYLHDWYSFAIFTTRSLILSRIRSRPGPRLANPSYFRATRLRNQRRSVSGATIPANCSRVFRPDSLAFALSSPLLIGESEFGTSKMFLIHANLFEKIFRAPICCRNQRKMRKTGLTTPFYRGQASKRWFFDLLFSDFLLILANPACYETDEKS